MRHGISTGLLTAVCIRGCSFSGQLFGFCHVKLVFIDVAFRDSVHNVEHYVNTPMQNTANFISCDIFLIFAQNIGFG